MMPRAKDGPHPIDIHVGQAICRRRLARGFNQSDLGRALGLTFQQVQKYEKGANRVSASKLHDTAKFLGCSVMDFFPQAGEEPDNAELPSSPVMDRRAFDLLAAFDGLDVAGKRAVIDVARALVGASAMRQAADDAGVPLQAAA